ncbi:unnamed protein product [Linum trigynum]|uniref:Zinc knuckle CX2CX4HX4C domain-containing protein n=1 Tax=Linum trigynum TaxID=586398 RepID=A0AAV2GPW0_9ROSI
MSVNDLINQAGEWDLEMVPDEGRLTNRFSLVVKVFSERSVSLRAVRGMIRAAWVDNPKPRVQEMPNIQPVYENVFTLDFEKQEEMEAIWLERPCHVSGTLMQMKKLSGLETARDISFKMVDFWVQIHNLPEAYRTESNIAMVSRMFHQVIDIDRAALQAQMYRKYVRVFVQVDTSRPIPDGFYIRQQQKRIWVEFKYEKLFSLCYYCGGIEHTRLECDRRRADEENGAPIPEIQRWGPWTRANSPLFSPRTNQQQEAEVVVIRDAASTSNSPGGGQTQSPKTASTGAIDQSKQPATASTGAIDQNRQLVPHAFGTPPGTNQSPISSFDQNYSLSPQTGLFPTQNFFSPVPQSFPLFSQNLPLFASPPQGEGVARNLFGFPQSPVLPFPHTQNTTPQIHHVGFGLPSPNPPPIQAQTHFTFNHHFFLPSPSRAQTPTRHLAINQDHKNRNITPRT